MISRCFRFVFTFLAVLSLQSFAQTNLQTQRLLPGQMLEREMTGAESHPYVVSLKKDEFFQVRVQQKGSDVTLKLADSKGKVLATMDSPNKDKETETLSFVAGADGNYLLEVSGFDDEAPRGKYTIKRELPRTATVQDKKRVEVEKAFVAGLEMAKMGNLQPAISKLRNSLKGWIELKDNYLAELTSNQISELEKSPQETEKDDERLLQIGDTVQREIKSKERHTYSIKLKKGQVLQVNLTEKGIDVGLGLFRVSDSEIIATSDFGFGFNRERITKLIEEDGDYIFFIETGETAMNGSYQFDSILKESATDLERNQIAAETLLADGLKEREKGTVKDLRTGIYKLEEAIIKWKELKDEYWLACSEGFIGIMHFYSAEKPKALEHLDLALVLYRKVKDESGEANVLVNIGAVYAELGENGKALEHFNQALPLIKKLGDKNGEASISVNIGSVYSETGESQKALNEYYNPALILFRALKDEAGEASTLANMGLIYDDLGEKLKALNEYYEPALTLYRKIEDKGGESAVLTSIALNYSSQGDREKALSKLNEALDLTQLIGEADREATVLTNIGTIYSSQGDKQIALNNYNQALTIFKSINDRKGQATTLNNIGIVYKELGEKFKALNEYYNPSLNLYREIGNKSGEAAVLNQIGLIYADWADDKTAFEHYNQALALRRTMGEKSGEAATLNNIGVMYAELGENQAALDILNQALGIRRKIGEKDAEATTLNNIGLVYSSLGDKKKALIDYYQEALKIYKLIGSKDGQAATLNNIGSVHSSTGEKEMALENYKQALVLVKSSGNKYGEATTLLNIGSEFAISVEKQKALDEYYNPALILFKAIEDKSGEATVLNNIADLYSLQKNDLAAVRYYNKSLFLYKSAADKSGQALVLTNLMVAWGFLGKKDLAIFYGKQSVNIYQQLRYFIEKSSKVNQRIYLKTLEEKYRLLAELLLSEKRVAEAVQVLEMLKREEAFSFQRLPDNRQKLSQLSTVSPLESLYIDKIENYFGEISPLILTLDKLRQMKQQGLALNSDQKSELEKLTVEVEKIEREFDLKIQSIAEDFAKSPAKEKKADISLPVQSELAGYGEDTAFLYTLVGEVRYWIILVTNKSLISQSFDIKKADLNSKIEVFRSDLQNKEADPRDAGRELYELLINKTIGNELRQLKLKTLLWSLDGKLRLMPLAALWTGEKYFGQEYRNVNVTVSDRFPLNKSVSQNWNVLGAGTSETQNITLPNQKTKQFDGLKYVKSELMGLVKENEEESGLLLGKRLYNANFTAAALNKQLDGKYKVIHFASHFALNPGNMEDSYLILGDGNVLTVKDIRDEKKTGTLNSELLVLSACETGVIGKDSNGIEIEGFAYIAQDRGADAILSSLWKVADESTSLFMQEFYRMRKADPTATKAAIIQKIQEKMMSGEIKGSDSQERTEDKKQGDKTTKPTLSKRFSYDPEKPYQHPYFWAPFVLIGNWK